MRTEYTLRTTSVQSQPGLSRPPEGNMDVADEDTLADEEFYGELVGEVMGTEWQSRELEPARRSGGSTDPYLSNQFADLDRELHGAAGSSPYV